MAKKFSPRSARDDDFFKKNKIIFLSFSFHFLLFSLNFRFISFHSVLFICSLAFLECCRLIGLGLKVNSSATLVFIVLLEYISFRCIKLLLVFIPVYGVAYLSQSMIYVLPTIAVFILLGANIQSEEGSTDASTSKEENDSDASD